MKLKRGSAVVVSVLAFTAFSGVAQATPPPAGHTVHVVALPTVKHFKNCTAMNKVYPHGVGKRGAKDSTSGIPVRNFTRNKRIYRLFSTSATNGGIRDLDRDNDGIACEKR